MKSLFNLFLILLFVLFTNTPLFSQENKNGSPSQMTAEGVYENTLQSYKRIKSYSYTNYLAAYDWFAQKAIEKAKNNYGTYINRVESEYLDNNGKKDRYDPSRFKKGIYGYKFLKPFTIEMVLIESDYVPSLINNSILRYRPDKDPKRFKFHLRGSPTFSVTRSIYDESGGLLTMNWTIDLIMMEELYQNGTLRLVGKEKIDGRDCYLLEFSFDKDMQSWMIKPNFLSYDIPKDIYHQLYASLFDITKKNFSKVRYWIDDDQFVIVKVVEYIDGRLYSSRLYKDIEINNLSPEDF